MYKAGIFDIGGVLQIQDVMGPLKEDACKTLGVPFEIFETIWSKFEMPLCYGEVEEEEVWKEMIKAGNSSKTIPTESLLLSEYVKNFSINSEVSKIIRELKGRGLKLAALTSTIKPHTEFNKTHGLYDEFDVKLFSNEMRIAKPDPRAYEMCLKELNVRPEEAFFIDDREINLVPARQMGITSILFENPAQLRQALEKLGVLRSRF